jgi:hypothetical protein
VLLRFMRRKSCGEFSRSSNNWVSSWQHLRMVVCSLPLAPLKKSWHTVAMHRDEEENCTVAFELAMIACRVEGKR